MRIAQRRMATDYLNVYRGSNRSAKSELAPLNLPLGLTIIALPAKKGIPDHEN
jgi:hypothetical protein